MHQSCEGVVVRWDMALNQKRLALFAFPRDDIRLMVGDELRLKYNGELHKFEL